MDDVPFADAFRQFSRNGRWGTCAACPRDAHGNVYPEACQFTARDDHALDVDSLAEQWKWAQPKPPEAEATATFAALPIDANAERRIERLLGEAGVEWGPQTLFPCTKCGRHQHALTSEGECSDCSRATVERAAGETKAWDYADGDGVMGERAAAQACRRCGGNGCESAAPMGTAKACAVCGGTGKARP